MTNAKFRLLEDDIIEVWERKLYRIESLEDFANVQKGDKGGYLEKEENLATTGDAWVFGNARVTGNARVSGNARVTGNARVSGNAEVFGNAWVSGDAEVFGNAWVFGNVWVSGNAEVFGNAWVSGDAEVFGDARVYGNARVFGNVRVTGNARVSGNADLIAIYPIGSESGILTAFKNKEGKISVTRGCFAGTLEEFAVAVEKTHGDNNHAKSYRIAIELIKSRLEE